MTTTNIDSEILTILRDSGEITVEDYKKVLQKAHDENIHPLIALLRSGIGQNRRGITKSIAQFLGGTFFDLSETTVDKKVADLVPQQFATSNSAVPLFLGETNQLTVVVPVEKLRSVQLKDDLARTTGISDIAFVVATKIDIKDLIGRTYRADSQLAVLSSQAQNRFSSEQATVIRASNNAQNEIPEEIQAESEVIKFVDLVLAQAVADKASDVHFESYETKLQIRYRIDGVLYEVAEAPTLMKNEIISRLKYMADLDITKKEIPQDGRLTVKTNGRKIDFRVATLPSVWGEKVTMRILDNTSANLPLASLGFTQNNLERFREAYNKANGVVLVTGPTGSGKSTTLYSALGEIVSSELNIITVEDPVEYQIGGITQVPVSPERGLTFEKVLRTVLRSDPDVILVGEVRDEETAQIAMRAGLTGHLVLSTLHTNDAASALTRLTDMNVESFIVGSTVSGVVSQRLVRKLCEKCKEAYTPTLLELDAVGFPHGEQAPTLYKPVGCRVCNNTGYRGRVGIHEVLLMSETMQEKIIAGAKSLELNRLALEEGMVSIRADGYFKVGQGLTTIEEVVRITV